MRSCYWQRHLNEKEAAEGGYWEIEKKKKKKKRFLYDWRDSEE